MRCNVGYLPRHYAEIWVGRGDMKPLLPERLTYEVEHSMITYAGRPLSEAARAFIDDLFQAHNLPAGSITGSAG